MYYLNPINPPSFNLLESLEQEYANVSKIT